LITGIVLVIVLLAEAANGWTDAPCGTSAAVASGVLKSRTALWVTAICNFIGLIAAAIFGAAVAKTIGTGIVRPEMISVASIGIAMLTTVVWSAFAAKFGLPVSKTHSLIAALAGIGFAQGGIDALLPASGHLADSGWLAVGKGVFYAVTLGFFISWLLSTIISKTRLHERLSETWWKWAQRGTVCMLASGHGFNDGLKYVGVFTLVLLKSGMIPEFHILPEVIGLCAIVLGLGTLLAGWRIHDRLDMMVNGSAVKAQVEKKSFRPYMGVCSELTAGASIWQSGWFGIPMSTNHAVVSAMAGARSASGKLHTASIVKIMGGWIITYGFCFGVADIMTSIIL
jgi:PiT family inorganic phosphate transporter